MKEFDLVIIPCCGPKLGWEAPARELYISPLFSATRGFCERAGLDYWILSALHGIIGKDEIIGPYNLAFKDGSREHIAMLRRRYYFDGTRILSFCGRLYDEFLQSCGSPIITNALRGLTIGRRMQALNGAANLTQLLAVTNQQ